MNHALVVGGLGVSGFGIVQHLASRPDWTVHAVSRRRPDDPAGATWHSCDLLDRDAVERALGGLRDITHIFYVAYLAKPTFAEEVAPNLAMLVNTVEVIERASPNLQHVSLMQGTKAYGTHLGAYKTPARETDPRHMPPNYHYDQVD